MFMLKTDFHQFDGDLRGIVVHSLGSQYRKWSIECGVCSCGGICLVFVVFCLINIIIINRLALGHLLLINSKLYHHLEFNNCRCTGRYHKPSPNQRHRHKRLGDRWRHDRSHRYRVRPAFVSCANFGGRRRAPHRHGWSGTDYGAVGLIRGLKARSIIPLPVRGLPLLMGKFHLRCASPCTFFTLHPYHVCQETLFTLSLPTRFFFYSAGTTPFPPPYPSLTTSMYA